MCHHLDVSTRSPWEKLDHWIKRQREYVLRLPKWLVGTWTVSVVAFSVWCVVYDKGLMPPLSRFYGRNPAYAVTGTIAFTTLAGLALLYGLARLIRPPAPTNLPPARTRD